MMRKASNSRMLYMCMDMAMPMPMARCAFFAQLLPAFDMHNQERCEGV